jgi:hypothetical protein
VDARRAGGRELRDRHFGRSRRMAVFLAACSASLTGLAVAAVWLGWQVNTECFARPWAAALGVSLKSFEAASTYLCLLLLAAVTLRSMVSVFKQRATVLSMSAQGICDHRITPQLIPRRAIQDVSVYRTKGGKSIVLLIEPAILATLALPPHLKTDRALGIKGITITTKNLGVRHGKLKRLIQTYHRTVTGSA